MKKILILTLAVLFCSCGANLVDKITVVSPVNWEVETLSRVRVVCSVDNSSCHAVHILEGRMRLYTDMGTLATAMLGERVKIPRRAVSDVEIPLRVKFDNPLALLSMPAGVRVSGEATVRVGPVRRKIHVENKPVSEFIDNLSK